MTGAATIANRYIALWNETDPGRRKAMLADLWSDAGTYLDPLMQGQGHDQIDALIAGVHGQFPDFRFALVGQPDGYGDQVRFSWQLGPQMRGRSDQGYRLRHARERPPHQGRWLSRPGADRRLRQCDVLHRQDPNPADC